MTAPAPAQLQAVKTGSRSRQPPPQPPVTRRDRRLRSRRNCATPPCPENRGSVRANPENRLETLRCKNRRLPENAHTTSPACQLHETAAASTALSEQS